MNCVFSFGFYGDSVINLISSAGYAESEFCELKRSFLPTLELLFFKLFEDRIPVSFFFMLIVIYLSSGVFFSSY